MTAGLLLAAGAGRRMGTPKALVHDLDGIGFLDRSLQVLHDGGCADLTVVLGASSQQAGELLARAGWADVSVVVAEDWQEGMGASLRAGLRAVATDPGSDVVLVSLIDLPDVGAPVLRRVVDAASGPAALVRATYGGRPGHPVLIGRHHWAGVVDGAHGDRGARDYLAAHQHVLVECGDLAGGRDVDSPQDLLAGGS